MKIILTLICILVIFILLNVIIKNSSEKSKYLINKIIRLLIVVSIAITFLSFIYFNY